MISLSLILAVILTFLVGVAAGFALMNLIFRYGVKNHRDVRDTYRSFIEKYSGPGEYEGDDACRN